MLAESRYVLMCKLDGTPSNFSKISSLANPLGTTLTELLVFGSNIVALTEDGRHLLVWDGNSGGLSYWHGGL